jgi:hypothetical protein
MRIRPRQAGAKLTLLSWLSPTGGAANRQRLLLPHFHNCIMPLVLNSKLVNSDHPGSQPWLWFFGSSGEHRCAAKSTAHLVMRRSACWTLLTLCTSRRPRALRRNKEYPLDTHLCIEPLAALRRMLRGNFARPCIVESSEKWQDKNSGCTTEPFLPYKPHPVLPTRRGVKTEESWAGSETFNSQD